MKKTKLTILMTAIVFSSIFMISCGSDTSTSKKVNDTEITSTDKSNSSNVVDNSNKTTNTSATSKKDNKNQSKNFYGKWTINKLIKSGKVSTHSEEDIKALIGQTFEFSASDIKYKGSTFTNPTYSFEDINSDKFETYYRMSFKDLGITGDKITEISIDNYDNMNDLLKNDKALPGFSLLATEDNSLILSMEGDFFELTKAN